jgi:hypothetical protein
MEEKIIEVPEANEMPLERWTAYMYCEANSLMLEHGTFSIGTVKGMSIIRVQLWRSSKEKTE